MDHYQTLGISPDASPEAIRTAFRELSRRHHPDTAGTSETKRFQAVKAAYDVLRDPEARAKYDADRVTAAGVKTPHFTWSNIAQPPKGAKRGKGGAARPGPDEKPDLESMVDAYFGRWNEPERP